MRHFTLWTMALVTVMAGLGTVARAADPSPEDVAFFESRIRPLLLKHCAECHSDTAKSVKGGLKLDRAESLHKGGDSGAAVVAGKPEESLLIQAVRYTDAALQMPPAGKLADTEIADLVKWVERGTPFPKATDDTNSGKKRVIDVAAGREFWSIRPLQRSNPAALRQAQWPARRIDEYLLATLEARGLTPSPRADRRTLVRRAYFDVVGLPPTPEEVDAFVADDSADAWPRLVERLLASPHYGERWGRYWLDLVRYCDIPESWARTEAHAWLYRDWVVQAFNDDVPYNQFVIRQLAADQLPDFQPRDVAALGFLGLSPSYWKELKLAPDVIKTVVAEEWEERINTVSGTLLGLTVACARCHDHKFDPIQQQDYYALAGVFASVRLAPLPMLGREEARRVAEAHIEVKRLEEEAERQAAMAKREPAKAEEWKKKAEGTRAQARALKEQTPHYSDPLAYAIEDAAISVLPDGPNRTKVEYAVGTGQNVAMQIRGNPARPADVVPRRYVSVLSPGEPATFTQGSGRREFAEAIFRDSAPLAARVIVNRVWRHHFGRGLVETPSNFGVQGSRPTHPELLDDLAARFIENGWSFKWLHREILLSAAWQQSSIMTETLRQADPDNLLLARMSRRRLDVEAWRDAMLSASGLLNLQVGGPAQELAEPGHVRRTLYAVIHRRDLNDFLRLYDVPDPTGHSPARIDTTTPLQQLYVLNSDFITRQATALRQRLFAATDETPARVELAHRLLYGRGATDREVVAATTFLGATPSEQTWSDYVEVLLARNELLFVD